MVDSHKFIKRNKNDLDCQTSRMELEQGFTNIIKKFENPITKKMNLVSCFNERVHYQNFLV